MSIGALLQIGFNLGAIVAMISFALRLRRPPQDDPRLSRGLQLLQTKITILEDLSDRTDAQVKQLTSLLDQKTRGLQNKVIEAEEQLVKIDHSMARSLEVAEIFQDKIPHREIVERRQKVEYVRAARLAHAGTSVEDIANQVDLPREQIELIAKFNRERLLFDEAQLPEWVERAPKSSDSKPNSFAMGDMDFLQAFEGPRADSRASREQVDHAFKASVEEAKRQEAIAKQSLRDSKVAEHLRATVASGVQSVQPAVLSMRATAQTLRNKLVATAEDFVRAKTELTAEVSPPAETEEESSPLGDRELRRALESAPTVRKVNFPRIDRPV